MSLQAISFDLQITPGSIPPVLHMSQYDSGRQFTAYLKDETNAAFAPGTGATAKIKGFNAAGVPWEQAATVDGSTVVFTPSGAATDQFGVMPVTIEITVGEEVLTPLLVVFDIQRAGYTNEEAVRSPEFQTALEAAVAAAIEEGGLGFSEEFKEALLACFAHVAWADEEGQTSYDALEEALYPGPTPVTLVSITADYLQDRPIYDTDDLDAIKVSDDLTVTANYSDGSSVVLDDDDYTLSGTLTVGTSIITVSYGGKTTTISVTVTAGALYTLPMETTFDGNTSINTGVMLMETDSDFTIRMDFVNGIHKSNSIIFDCRNAASPTYGCGFYQRSSEYWAFTGMVTTNVDTAYPTTYGKRLRLVIRYDSTTKTFTVDGTVDGERKAQGVSVTTKDISSVTNPLYIAGPSNNSTTIYKWSGLLKQFDVWGRKFTDSEVTAYLGVS